MSKGWLGALTRWNAAGLIDDVTADRIRAFEREHAGSQGLRWPVWIVLPFGALMLGAGVLLFVSAQWDNLSPQIRFALVASLVGVFHLAATIAARRFPPMASTLHAVGTIALGGGVYLAGQIFHLDEHWPAGLMLWALGAGVAWALLKDWPQMALAAILVPVWLSSEWIVATSRPGLFAPTGARVVACGSFLLALTYFSAVQGDRADPRRRVLLWLGSIALVPAAITLAAASSNFILSGPASIALPVSLQVAGWTGALLLPLALAFALRRGAAWANAFAALWTVALLNVRSIAGDVGLYAWWALGAAAIVAWGVREARNERINMGSAMFAVTVMSFYFSQVMDKLGRSASLIGFGLVLLAGGWALERVRRRLVDGARGGRA